MSRDPLRAANSRVDDPGRIVLIAGTGGKLASYTHDELDAAVDARASELRAGGVRPGAVVPRVVEPDLAGVLELLALWRVGAVPAPLGPSLTEAERTAAEAGLVGASPKGAQVVLWTSGTAGRARGVVLGWEGMSAHVEAVGARLGLEPARDVWLASLAPAHVGGLMLAFRALSTGSTLFAPGKLGVDGLAHVVGTAGPGVTHLSLVPTQLARLMERVPKAPAHLRCVLLGGAHAPEELVARALRAGWPLALTWGMTEMSSQVATATPAEVRKDLGSCGRPLHGVEVRAAPDGELRVRGPTAALGYLDGTPLRDEEGWYRTGDLGRVDPAGRVWITGRRTDRIVSGGVTVDAHEVEEVLRSHPAVLDACVVGVPDPEWGEVVGACVVVVEGEYDALEVEQWVRSLLGPAKRPRRWAAAAALPLNANGKVDRAAVLALLERAG